MFCFCKFNDLGDIEKVNAVLLVLMPFALVGISYEPGPGTVSKR